MIFNLKDVIQWIDDIDLSTLQKFNQAYHSALTKDVPVEDKKSESSVEIDFKKDVISFACGELGIMRLSDVYDMTFAEFQIRLFAYRRMQLEDWKKYAG